MCDYLSDKFKMTKKKALKKSFLMDIKRMEKLSKVWFPELERYVKNNEKTLLSRAKSQVNCHLEQ